MVNFRYHLVTITAIFLALAAGIVLGVAVSDTVANVLKERLDSVQADSELIDAENDALRRDLATWDEFGDSASPGLLAGRLADVPVLLVGVRGVDGDVAKDVRETLARSDAEVLGTVWLTRKLRLDRTEDTAELAGILGLPVPEPQQVRSIALSRLARQLAAPERPRPETTPGTTAAVPDGSTTTAAPATVAPTTTTVAPRVAQPTLLARLATAGFVDLEDPAGGTLDPQVLLPEQTRFVVLSAEDVDVVDDLAAIPFVRGIVEAAGSQVRVVAVEPGRPARRDAPEVRSVFIGRLRGSGREVDEAISTVNNLEDFRGQVTMVLALADLGLGRVGHYGLGSSADRLVPEAG